MFAFIKVDRRFKGGIIAQIVEEANPI